MIKARFKRRISHVPNLMQMSENNRFSVSFALDSAHVKCDILNGPKQSWSRIPSFSDPQAESIKNIFFAHFYFK